MMILLHLLLGLAIYTVLIYVVGRHLRTIGSHYPSAPTPRRRAHDVRAVILALPTTLPQRGPGLLAMGMARQAE